MSAEKENNPEIFEKYESNVRSYCRSFPTVFCKGKGAFLYDEKGRKYIDFFAGAGALNYGHNPDFIKEKLIEFLSEDNVMHALDMFTSTKREFIEKFNRIILSSRGLDYKIQFCGPTGANAVEASLKLARLFTKRNTVCFFTGGWHGMSLGCLSVTGNRENRQSAGVPLSNGVFLPYCQGPSSIPNSLDYFESLLADPNSGIDTPAAVIVETIQAEGGIYIADIKWLQRLRQICDKYEILMIADEIQVGCGRTGTFFSFERAEIVPDIVCLSKSIGGYGFPMAITLIRPEIDIWTPGQHTGTFRGNQLAFFAATAALDLWKDSNFATEVKEKGIFLKKHLTEQLGRIDPKIQVRGLGCILGIDLSDAGGEQIAKRVSKLCFEAGLIIERCGRQDVVLKVLPPLIIDRDTLSEGCSIICEAIKKCHVYH